MKKFISVLLITVIAMTTLVIPCAAEGDVLLIAPAPQGVTEAQAEALLEYVPYSAHENEALENTDQTYTTDAFIRVFIQQAVKEFGINTKDKRYYDAFSDGYAPITEIMNTTPIPEDEIYYTEDDLKAVMTKVFGREDIPYWNEEDKVIYSPYYVGGFLYNPENEMYFYRRLSYMGGDFQSPVENSSLKEAEIESDELYIYEAYTRRSPDKTDDMDATYKHTYKKNANGEWYWAESQLLSIGEEIADTSDSSPLPYLLATASVITAGLWITIKKAKKA